MPMGALSSTPPIEKEAFGSLLTTVANFTFNLLLVIWKHYLKIIGVR